MCQIEGIVVGKEYGHMQLGNNILVNLNKFLIKCKQWSAMFLP